MNKEITQAKFSKEYNGKTVSVICTRSNICSSCWDCKFSKTSLQNIVDIVVELFNCATLIDAEHLSLHFGNHFAYVDKCTEDNSFTHYLEVIASKIVF